MQAFKLLGLSLFLPLPLAATVLLAAHLAIAWLPYIAYRHPGVGIEAWRAPNQLFRLQLALFFAVILGASQLPLTGSPAAALDTSGLWQLAAGLAFFAFKARRHLGHVLHNARWLKRSGPPGRLRATSAGQTFRRRDKLTAHSRPRSVTAGRKDPLDP